MNYTILRYFNVAGTEDKMRSGLASKFSTHLIKVACEVGQKKEYVIINGMTIISDGTTIRDYIHMRSIRNTFIIVKRSLEMEDRIFITIVSRKRLLCERCIKLSTFNFKKKFLSYR